LTPPRTFWLTEILEFWIVLQQLNGGFAVGAGGNDDYGKQAGQVLLSWSFQKTNCQFTDAGPKSIHIHVTNLIPRRSFAC
jgi:hypothetical protein